MVRTVIREGTKKFIEPSTPIEICEPIRVLGIYVAIEIQGHHLRIPRRPDSPTQLKISWYNSGTMLNAGRWTCVTPDAGEQTPASLQASTR